MKTLLYIFGATFVVVGFADGPNPFLGAGIPLLILGWKYDAIFQNISSKNATNKLLKLAELRDKGIIDDAEYEEKATALKSKI